MYPGLTKHNKNQYNLKLSHAKISAFDVELRTPENNLDL